MEVRRKLAILLAGLFLIVTNSIHASAADFNNKTSEQKKVISPGVTHIKQTFTSGSIKQSVNVLDVNLSNPYATIELGIPDPLKSLKTTSSLAKENSFEGHRIAGAVNASFFSSTGPQNLLAKNNEIINYGILGERFESPTQNPVAFGISKDGKAIADYYEPQLTFTVDGKSYIIDRINNERTADKTVLYTPAQYSTETNEWGMEIIVSNASQNVQKLHFGDTFTGEVSAVTNFGSGGNAVIPKDGFVLSIHDEAVRNELSAIVESGSTIEVTIGIEDKWMDAEFILAAGPLLLKNGETNISMPTNSSFVKDRHPRTVVGVDATGTKVFLVTVDGRQSGHSNGTSLTELASYLKSLGATSAINFDGGGSTTMVVKDPGAYYPTLVNKPADSYERRVSAILQVVNNAPRGKVTNIKLSSTPHEVVKDSKFSMEISYAWDEHLNPISVDPEQMNWSVEGTIGVMNGATFTATTSGEGKIIGEYEGVRVEAPIKVIDLSDKPYVLNSFDHASNWSAKSARAKASITNSSTYEPFREGNSSLKLSYDFTTGEEGTKTAEAIAIQPIPLIGKPNHIGVWVYGDGKQHWLRGTIIDGKDTRHTIDFTKIGGLDWTGWKYVTTTIPDEATLPLRFEKLYIAQPNSALQNKGVLYFDQLQAVYVDHHEELVFTDVSTSYWAYDSIQKLNKEKLINGYMDGTFRPYNSITRAEAATIIANALELTAKGENPFFDVEENHYANKAITAVAEHGIIIGKRAGEFDPRGHLTRAEMAAILTRAYKLQGLSDKTFPDVASTHWAYDYIQTLVANNLTTGDENGNYKPDAPISRAQFATFIDRVME